MHLRATIIICCNYDYLHLTLRKCLPLLLLPVHLNWCVCRKLFYYNGLYHASRVTIYAISYLGINSTMRALNLPLLEYASPAWSPYIIKDINSLESVQKFALKVCLKQWNMPYCQLLNQSHLPDLGTHRKHLSLCYFYNIYIVNGVHVYPNLPLVPHSPQHVLRNTHSFMQFNAHTNHFSAFFFPTCNCLMEHLT